MIKQVKMSHTLIEEIRASLRDGSPRCDTSEIAAISKTKSRYLTC
jgi:hypothetical protein